jgi:hypothetical protein
VSAKVEVSDRGRIYKLDRDAAVRKVFFGAFRWVDNFHIERHVRANVVFDGWLGTGNALPFTRIQNKMCKPQALHYCIPAVGAHERLLRCRNVNQTEENRCRDINQRRESAA